MPSTGTPASNRAGSTNGAPAAYTDDGPPDRMIAAGSFARRSWTDAVCGTISEYTLASRTRRAMSCAYWAPKSTTSTGRASVPEFSSGPRAWGATLRLSRGPGLSFSPVGGRSLALMGGLRGDGRALPGLPRGEVVLHLAGDPVLGEEGEERHHAAGGDQQEPRDRPPQVGDEDEVADEVREVEVPVDDLRAEAEI